MQSPAMEGHVYYLMSSLFSHFFFSSFRGVYVGRYDQIIGLLGIVVDA